MDESESETLLSVTHWSCSLHSDMCVMNVTDMITILINKQIILNVLQHLMNQSVWILNKRILMRVLAPGYPQCISVKAGSGVTGIVK